MNIEEQRVKFVNVTMEYLHNLCNDLYEALIEEDFNSVEKTIQDIYEVLKDLEETFQNEI
jgi:hypothetical protein